MKLAWSEFEQKFRREHREELRTAPELKERFRKARKAGTASAGKSRRVLSTIALALIFGVFLGRVRHPEFGLAVISLWTAGTAFRKAREWFQSFYGSEDLLVLNLLPVSDEQIFRIQSRKFVLQFGWMLLGLVLIYLTVGVMQYRTGSLLLAFAPVAAILQVALVFSLSLHGAVFLHTLPLGAIAGLFRSTAVFLALAGPLVSDLVPYVVQFSYWFFPTGWLNYAFAQVALRQDWPSLILLLPLGALIYAGVYSWQRLRAFYSLEGFEIVPSPGLFGVDEHGPARRGATEIQDTIQEGSFLQALNWTGGGWIEKLISRGLKGRDRTVLEFLVAEDPKWTRSLRNSLWLFALGVAVIYLFGQESGFIVFFPAYLLASVSLPLFGGEWRGLQQFPNGGLFLPAYAVYPVTFAEIIRLLLRVNIVRTLAAAPLLLALAALASWRLGHSPLTGVAFALKGFALFLALQPFLVLLPVSRSTNDTARFGWLWLVLLPVIVLLLIFSVALFVAPESAAALVCIPSVLLLSTLWHFIYRRAFHRGRFDLLSRRNPDSE